MRSVSTMLRLSFAALMSCWATNLVWAQGAAERSTDQYLCKDVMREAGQGRDVAIAFIHGIFLGKSGSNKFNLEVLEKQTDAFTDYCLNKSKREGSGCDGKGKAIARLFRFDSTLIAPACRAEQPGYGRKEALA